ncbi:phosphomannomutase CpsG [Edwardsiella tarda]|uniref:phosphomannomutase CpsG n=1 Tax=Edwardsiella tarda TaxID=636 RepID=UPI00244515E4|nr:phosphomannomutase CpsG [Edwardsiella tarda]WGE30138.1 phosphomannomutase CpsG [Edwardsiella tarda]
MTLLTCFKSYDVRGKLGEELNTDIAWRIGFSFARVCKLNSVVLGGDARKSSPDLKKAFANGLMEAGVNVIDIGLSGTEEIYYASSFLDVDGGVQITASHNPINYNGMKFVLKNGVPVGNDTGLREIRELAESNNFVLHPSVSRGNYRRMSIKDSYVNYLLSYIDLSKIKPLKIVVNSGNGAAGPVIDLIEQKFTNCGVPVSFIKINNDPDGDFPNGIPNPLLPECRRDTSIAVTENEADLGIAFDGDFDRCFFFDRKGHFIDGYYVVGLLSRLFLSKASGSKIVYDSRVYWNTESVISVLGGTPVISKAGHVFIKEKMRLENAVYGGEMSGHHYFKDFNYCDSGMIPWLLLVELLSTSNVGIDNLVMEMEAAYPCSGEININKKDTGKCLDKVLSVYGKNAIRTSFIDGISIEFECWRFNLRCSNTEPLLRLNVETKGDQILLMKKTEELLSFIDAI